MSMILDIIDLTLQAGNKSICSHLNWQIRPTEHWAILGQNGSGKSTLLNHIAGLQTARRGKINLDGHDLEQLEDRQRAKSMGYLFQDTPRDFPQSVFEFCLNGLHPHLSRFDIGTEKNTRLISKVLAKTDLAGFEARHINTLSGGEFRRLEIAALILQKPRLWLLDEPVNHLDIAHQHQMLNLLITEANQQSGATVTVLHDANLAYRFCSHVLMIFNDGTVLQGSKKELLNQETLSHLYGINIQCIKNLKQRFFTIA